MCTVHPQSRHCYAPDENFNNFFEEEIFSRALQWRFCCTTYINEGMYNFLIQLLLSQFHCFVLPPGFVQITCNVHPSIHMDFPPVLHQNFSSHSLLIILKFCFGLFHFKSTSPDFIFG